MRTKSAPALPGKPAPHAVTLTLDMMDEPPLPTKPVRRASVRQASSAPTMPPAKPLPVTPTPTAKAAAKLPPVKANTPSTLPVRPAKAPVPSVPAPRVPATKAVAERLAAKPKAPTAAPKAKGNTPAAPPAASQSARRVPVPQAAADVPAAKPAAKPKVPVAAPIANGKLAAAKANPVAIGRAPKAETVSLEREMVLEGGGRVWRMSGRHAVAYVQTSALACALLAVETRHLSRHAMAVYYDKKGRAIAWQVRFDTQRWEDVMRQLG